MTRDDIQKLLGGYATGTLTPEEQRVLFAAALEDQDLFDALAREEALREVLSDPASRAHLLAVMEERRAPWYRRMGAFWPRALPIAALAAIVVMVGISLWQPKHTPEPRQLAKVELPPPQITQRDNALILPSPPEMRRAAPSPGAPVSLPGVRPAKAPAPPEATPAATPATAPPPVFSAQQSITINGAPPAPMAQQNQQNLQNQPKELFGARNALLAQDFLSANTLTGVVTDPAGAAIAGAIVEAKSSAGVVASTSTDERGEFRIAEVPGTRYDVSATKPGFKGTTASLDTPAAGTPQPLRLRMDVGAAAEAVEVTASASTLKDSKAAVGGTIAGFAALHGVVTDTAGTGLPAVNLEIRSVATGQVTRAQTDDRGSFSASEPAGTYVVTASKQGFQTKSEEVAAAQPVNLRMAEAAKTETKT